jgi:hypothetical protein
VRCCRRFVRILHHCARRSKLGRVCARRHARLQRLCVWQNWQVLWAKQQHACALSLCVYHNKLLRSILHGWFSVAVTQHAATARAATEVVRLLRERHTFRHWKAIRLARMRQLQVNKTMNKGTRRRVFGLWRSYILYLRNIRKVRHAVTCTTLRPVLRKWHQRVRFFSFFLQRMLFISTIIELTLFFLSLCLLLLAIYLSMQYKERRLLCRVFTIQKEALRWRLVTAPSDFQLLVSVLQAWQELTVRSRIARRRDVAGKTACLFRGATLQARYFFLWMDFLAQAHWQRRKDSAQRMVCLEQGFGAWSSYVTRHRTRCEAVLREYVQRRFLSAWRLLVCTKVDVTPRLYYQRSLQTHAFNRLKVERSRRLLETVWLPRQRDKRTKEW